MVRILFCDDQARFRQGFVDRHSDHYEIIAVADIGGVSQKLTEMRTLPDLLLLDLYHPNMSGEEQPAKTAIAEASLADLDLQIDRTKAAVLDAWSPTGLAMLKLIRRRYPPSALPIALYTQKGLLLLDDAELREALQLNADWLLKKKNPDPAMERIWIERILHHAMADRANAAASKYKWILLFSWVALAVSLAAHFFPTREMADILAKTIAAAIGAVSAFALSRFIGPSKTSSGS